MPEKLIEGYLILNWKAGSFRVVKADPTGKLKNRTDIPFKLEITVKTPETPDMAKIEGEVVVSDTMVKKIILESLDPGTTIK